MKGDSEKDKTDRLRGRRKKKSAQRLRYKEKERNRKAVEKANPGMGNRHAKERVLRDLKTAEKEGTVSLVRNAITFLVVIALHGIIHRALNCF